jgi:hypothetical protein
MLALGCTTGEGREDVGLESLAGVACQHARACGCEEPVAIGSSGGTCESLVLEAWGYWLPPPADFGEPVFDPQCLDRAMEILRAAECDSDLSRFWFELPCALYHGTANVGDACMPGSPVYNPCLQGLVCIDQRCEPAHVAATPDLRPGVGESCVETAECNASAWCDLAAMDGPICRARGAVGDACMGHAQCLTGYCPAGFCDERPGEGEPCGANQICGEGLECITDRCARTSSCLPSFER